MSNTYLLDFTEKRSIRKKDKKSATVTCLISQRDQLETREKSATVTCLNSQRDQLETRE